MRTRHQTQDLTPATTCYYDLVIPFDTTPEIAAMQARILDAMSGEQRVLMAFEASHHVHELAKQRIRDEHPDWPEDKVTREFLRRFPS